MSFDREETVLELWRPVVSLGTDCDERVLQSPFVRNTMVLPPSGHLRPFERKNTHVYFVGFQ